MKTFLVASFLIAVAAISTAEAQTRQTFTAPTGDARTDRTERRTAAPTRARQAEGALPRAARGGNAAQMINPLAPRQYYGTVEDTVTYDPNDPRRITGIILVGIRW
ncbi:MAG TPA: hypothetical protein VK993_16195 [Chthoniobacterales bacterium]|nr:hypothetical protein [Chthoniobacterales bacterium]